MATVALFITIVFVPCAGNDLRCMVSNNVIEIKLNLYTLLQLRKKNQVRNSGLVEWMKAQSPIATSIYMQTNNSATKQNYLTIIWHMCPKFNTAA